MDSASMTISGNNKETCASKSIRSGKTDTEEGVEGPGK